MMGKLLPKYKLAVVNSCIFLIAFLCSPLLPQVTQHLHDRYVNILKLMSEDEYDQAILEFQRLISEHPDFHKAYKRLQRPISSQIISKRDRTPLKNCPQSPSNPYALYALTQN